jgi:predicted transposase YbfD/YdcC
LRRGQVIERKWQIEHDEKCEREQMHFEEVERAIIRKNIKESFRFWFVKKKTVIEPGEAVGGKGDDEV